MAAMAMFRANDDIVEIIADTGRGNTYSVHRALLKESSNYFRSTIDLSRDESNDLLLKIYGPVFIATEVPGDAVCCFVQWLYTGKLCSGPAQAGIDDILRLFKWTDKELENTGFHDFLVDKTIDIVTSSPITGNVYAILNHLDDVNGGMLMFLTDFLVHSKLHHKTLNAEIVERLSLCKNADAIYRGVAQSFLGMNIRGDGTTLPPWLGNRCQYHEHPALTCCSKAPGVKLTEALSDPRTPPPAPKKQKRKTTQSLDTHRCRDEPLDEIIVLDKKPRLPTPTRATRSSLRHPPAAPQTENPRRRHVLWSTGERIEILRLYWLNPELGHVGAAAQHNEGFCAARGYERAPHAVGGQYRELMSGGLEETRHLIPEKIAALEGEAEMEAEEGEQADVL